MYDVVENGYYCVDDDGRWDSLCDTKPLVVQRVGWIRSAIPNRPSPIPLLPPPLSPIHPPHPPPAYTSPALPTNGRMRFLVGLPKERAPLNHWPQVLFVWPQVLLVDRMSFCLASAALVWQQVLLFRD